MASELTTNTKQQLTKSGDLIVENFGTHATVKYGILYTIGEPDGIKISWADYSRIYSALQNPDAKFVDIRKGDTIAIGQITRLCEATKTLLSRAEAERRVNTLNDTQSASDELTEAQKDKIIADLRTKIARIKKCD